MGNKQGKVIAYVDGKEIHEAQESILFSSGLLRKSEYDQLGNDEKPNYIKVGEFIESHDPIYRHKSTSKLGNVAKAFGTAAMNTLPAVTSITIDSLRRSPKYKSDTEFAAAVEAFATGQQVSSEFIRQFREALKTGGDEPFGFYHGAAEVYAGELGLDISGGYLPEDNIASDDVRGGDCGCSGKWMGSAELDISSVRDYANSLNSITKDSIVNDIIDALKKMGLSAEGKSREETIKKVLELIPDGKTKKFKESEESHKKICMKLADIINERYGSNVVNKSLDPAIVCQQVAEIVYSLSASMHTEFLAVLGDVKNVLKNLHFLKDSLDETFAQVMDKIKLSNDPEITMKSATLTDLHKMISDEIARQIKLLQNLLNVTLTPAEVDLEKLIKHKKSIKGYIEKIDAKPGRSEFGDVIANVLKGLGLTANYALIIDRALKTVGITIDEYAKSDDLKDFIKKINDGLIRKKMSDAELHEYLQSADLLYKNFYRNKDIAKVLQEKSGRFEKMDPYSGGDDDNYPKTVMDKRVADKRRLRNLIMSAFYKQSNNMFDAVIKSIEVLGKKLGVEIPLSDQLDGFRDIMGRLTQDLIRHKGIYFALIGYYNDALSKSKRDQFIGELKMVSSYIDSIIEMSIYRNAAQYFKDIQSNIKALIELIDKFSDEVAAKFGRGELDPEQYKGGDEKDECMYLDEKEVKGNFDGGIDEDFSDSLPVEIRRKPIDIREAFRKFDYYYKVAQIRQNLNKTAKEIDTYSEKYERLLASAIGDKLNQIKKEFDDELAALKGLDVENVYGAGDAGKKETQRQKDAAIKFMEEQYATRKRFWQTVEAVDTYMRAFTDGLIKNPNDVKDIKSMLDEIEIISNWYNESTGDQVDQVFEFFPAALNGLGEQPYTALNTVPADVDDPNVDIAVANCRVIPSRTYRDLNGKNGVPDHLYKKISDRMTAVGAKKENALPGNPYLVADPTEGQKAKDAAKRAITSLAMLKNLISVFVHIGSKFGGEEIRKKTFMTPTQIYNNLCEYIQASAFSQTLGGLDKFTFAADKKTITDAAARTAAINLSNDQLAIVRSDLKKAAANHPIDTTYSGDRDVVLVGVTAGENTTPNARINFRHLAGVFMRSKSLETADKNKWLAKGFEEEDDYFVMLLKSIAAKIFTVVGMYDVFDRPFEKHSFNAIRMIIGGADDSIPKVETEATELYLRLPLLLLFYRNLFSYDGEYNDRATDPENDRYNDIKRRDKLIKVSLVPEVEGIWSGLIQLVFRKTKLLDNYSYSDADVKEIIKEVNLIYSKMKEKYPQNTVYDTIQVCVAEINRRYALVTREERDAYEREVEYRYDYGQYIEPAAGASRAAKDFRDRYVGEPEIDYAILPGEEDPELRRPAPSERFVNVDLKKEVEKYNLFNITQQHKRLLYKFRCAIEKHFAEPEEQYTFKTAIKTAQNKLKKEANDPERFKIISGLIRGVDIYSKNDNMKYLMFHETVVAGLNTLSAIHTLLLGFQKRVLGIDLKLIDELIDEVLLQPVAGEFTWEADAAPAKGLVAQVAAKIRSRYVMDNFFTNDHAKCLFGYGEANRERGGHRGGLDYVLKHVSGVPAGTNIDRSPAVGAHFGVRAYTAADAPHYPKAVANDFIFHSDVTAGAAAPAKVTLMDILCGYSVRELRDWTKQKTPFGNAKKAMMTFHRFAINREYVMKELIETVFGISKDLQGLVDVRIDEGRIFLNFNGLKTAIDDLFSSVSQFVDFFRPYIKPEIFKRYVSKQTPGSLYWLQEQLYEKILQGRAAQTLEPKEVDEQGNPWAKKKEYPNLELLAQKLNSTYMRLTQEWAVDGRGMVTNAVAISDAADQYKHVNYDRLLAEMIFYDSSKPASGLLRSESYPQVDAAKNHIPNVGPQLVDFMGKDNPYEHLMFNGFANQKILDTRYIARYKQLYDWNNSITPNRSMMFLFNQLIAKYIQQFYDPATQKIYVNTINSFVNGSFNRSVMDQMYTWPDVWPAVFLKTSEGGAGSDEDDKYRSVAILIGPSRSFLPQVEINMKKARATNATSNAPNSDRALSPNANSVVEDVAVHFVYDYLFALIRDINAQPGATTLDNFETARGTSFVDVLATIMAGATSTRGVMATPAAVKADLAHSAAGRATAYASNAITIDNLKNWLRNEIPKYATGVDLDALLEMYKAMANNDWESVINAIYSARGIATLTNVAIPEALILQLFRQGYATGPAGSLITQAVTIYPANTDAKARTLAAVLLALSENRDAAGAAKISKAIRDVRPSTIGVTARDRVITLKYDDAIMLGEQKIDDPMPDSVSKGESFIRLATHAGKASEGGNMFKVFDRIKKPGGGPGEYDWGLEDDRKSLGERVDPDPERILFTSLSVILKNIVTSKNTNNQTSVYTLDNINDVALNMKEKFRAEMPIFKSLFKEMINRADILKKLMSREEFTINREWPAGQPNWNPWPGTLLPVTTAASDADAKIRFTAILDSIVKGCMSFISSIDQVLREVGDDPKYLEVYQNSIKDYRAQYGKDPLMPISTMLVTYANKTKDNRFAFMPLSSLGQDYFKLHYGTRLLYGNYSVNPLMDHVPGFANLINDYNSIVDSREQIQKDKADGFMKALIKLARYVTELRHYKSITTTYLVSNMANPNAEANFDDAYLAKLETDGAFNRTQLVSISNVALSNRADMSIVNESSRWKDGDPRPIFAITQPFNRVINLTESSFKEDKIAEVAKYLQDGAGKAGSTLEVQNIVDLNIIPINVHALMRELPLINIYNYSYTFDRMIIELYYGLQNDNARKLIAELCSDGYKSALNHITSAKDMFIALLLDPYLNVFGNPADRNGRYDSKYYEKYVKSIFLGDTNMELGRPKFLSDQLYNKSLFGDLYAARMDYSEGGPSIGHGKRVGMIEAFRINALANLLYSCQGKLFGDNITGVGAGLDTNSVNAAKLIAAVARHAAETPYRSVSELIAYAESLTDVGAVFNNAINPTTLAGSKMVSHLLGTISAMMMPFIDLIISNALKGDSVNAAKAAYAAMHLLNTFGMGFTAGAANGGIANINSLKWASGARSARLNADINAVSIFGIAAFTGASVRISQQLSDMITNVITTTLSGLTAPAAPAGAPPTPRSPIDIIGYTDDFIKVLQTISDRSSVGESPRFTNTLTYIQSNNESIKYDGEEIRKKESNNNNLVDDRQVNSVNVGEIADLLHAVGHLRFDTVFIRNLVFIVNLYRSVRLKLSKDLVYNKEIIQRSYGIVRPDLTEYISNQVYQQPDMLSGYRSDRYL